MQSVKVRRNGISADQAAEVLRTALGDGYHVQPEGETTLLVRKGRGRAKVSLRGEPGGTVFEVSGQGVTVFPLFSLTTKMMNDRGIAKKTATAIDQAEAFRDDS